MSCQFTWCFQDISDFIRGSVVGAPLKCISYLKDLFKKGQTHRINWFNTSYLLKRHDPQSVISVCFHNKSTLLNSFSHKRKTWYLLMIASYKVYHGFPSYSTSSSTQRLFFRFSEIVRRSAESVKVIVFLAKRLGKVVSRVELQLNR